MMANAPVPDIHADQSVVNVQSANGNFIAGRTLWLVLAVANVLFVAWIYTSIHTKHDYEAFYSAGRAFLMNPHHVYEPAVQLRAGGIWKTESEILAFYHLPSELFIFAPLSLLSYARSLFLWRLLATASLLAAGTLLSRYLGLPTRNTLLAAVAFVPALLAIGEGQDSTLLLLVLVGTYVLLGYEHEELAGIVLSFGLFKPQIVCMVALAMLLSRRIRFFFSFAASVAALLGVCTFYLGSAWIGELTGLIRSQEAIQPPTRMVSLHGLFASVHLPHANSAALVASALIVIGGLVAWRKCLNLEITFGSAVLVGGLAAYHFHIYDATVFLLPIAILMKLGPSEWDRYSLVVFFLSPVVIFLMAVHLTNLITISVLVLLVSYYAHLRRELRANSV